MPGQPSGNEIVKTQQIRAFFQPGGAGPENRRFFAGQDMAYLRITGVSNPIFGGISGSFVPNPNKVDDYKSVATLVTPPDLPKANLIITDKHGAIPRQYVGSNCVFTLYEVESNCRDLSDFYNGWTDIMMIYPSGKVSTRDYGDRTSYEDKIVETTLGVTFPRKIYPVGSLVFNLLPSVLTGTVANDATFGPSASCVDCGIDNDGTKWVYAAVTGGAAAKPIVWWSNDGGKTVNQASIAAAANAEIMTAIGCMGNRLVVLSKLGGGTTSALYWADLNPYTGAPGTFTKVTTGFNATGQANDMVILSPSEAWLVGDGGYIYYTNDPSSGVVVSSAAGATTANLNRVDGNADILVVVGATGATLKSVNRGQQWINATSAPSGNSLTALGVVDPFNWFVGDASGGLFYTKNGGESWGTKTLETFIGVDDILVVSREVIYMTARITGPIARLWYTLDGGNTWSRTGSRISGTYPTHNGATRIVYPIGADSVLQANTVAIAGVSAVAANGALYVGSAGIY